MLTRKLIALTGIVIVAAMPVLGQTADAAHPGPRAGHHRPHHHHAQHARNGIDQRQHNQADRIKQGVRSGELTRNEARGLVKEQSAIRQTERQYKADGVLTRDERRDLHQQQNQASRHIYQEKHDGDKRVDHRVDQRQHNQADRIRQGVRSGELTKDEARGLVKEQREVRQLERQYKSDGVLARDERRDLNKELNQASRHIYQEKHDGEKR